MALLLAHGGDANQTIPLEGIGLSPVQINAHLLGVKQPEGSVLGKTECTVNRVYYDRLSLIELMIVMQTQALKVEPSRDFPGTKLDDVTTEMRDKEVAKKTAKYTEVLGALCKSSPDLNTGSSKLPPLVFAATIGASGAVSALLDPKLGLSIDINGVSTFDGRPAIQMSGPMSRDIANLLNDKGARTDIVDAFGVSASTTFRIDPDDPESQKRVATNYNISLEYNTNARITIGVVTPNSYSLSSLGQIIKTVEANPIPVDELLTPLHRYTPPPLEAAAVLPPPPPAQPKFAPVPPKDAPPAEILEFTQRLNPPPLPPPSTPPPPLAQPKFTPVAPSPTPVGPPPDDLIALLALKQKRDTERTATPPAKEGDLQGGKPPPLPSTPPPPLPVNKAVQKLENLRSGSHETQHGSREARRRSHVEALIKERQSPDNASKHTH